MSSFLERLKVPHVFTLLTVVIFICSLLTYIIPSGHYERESKNVGGHDRTVVVAGTYSHVDKAYSFKGATIGEEFGDKASPVSLIGFLRAIPKGMEDSGDIIFFIFMIGGVFGILQRTGVISASIQLLLSVFRNNSALLTIILMMVLAAGGSTLGMGEEFIPLVPIFLIVAKEMGFDRIYGLALVWTSSNVGFAAATTNPFTVSIANNISELPLNTGMTIRIIFFGVCMAVTIIYVLRYGAKIKADPGKSIMAGVADEQEALEFHPVAFTNRHLWIVIMGLVVFSGIIYAVTELGWWMAEMGGGFFLIGILAIVISGLSLSEAVKAFIKGMEEMVVAALVVGFARGIVVVLNEAQVLDTIIFSAAQVLQTLPKSVAAIGMFVFQTTLNFFIPSGSGQAAVTMPLMAPLADILGISRETAVFAFTCGDGFSNSLIPTSGVLMAMLSLAGIPYERWLRFVVPLFLLMSGLSALFLFLSVMIPGFWG